MVVVNYCDLRAFEELKHVTEASNTSEMKSCKMLSLHIINHYGKHNSYRCVCFGVILTVLAIIDSDSYRYVS